ncbi:mechanosensitive ion channel family protein [Ruficoccus amylovorans]|uniref:Mechanosensitive ion channel family protein n=1 Tax=Ruficoccus amylovorans TaxID=1804625 RepID=A0A842HFU8_9BACT|nr:mechanosensitive ion channel family protein [Ruficoccus amylovorans]MBC2594404.1 mechanosensitive ion channel family protein [Ruficoccus amylovorans]
MRRWLCGLTVGLAICAVAAYAGEDGSGGQHVGDTPGLEQPGGEVSASQVPVEQPAKVESAYGDMAEPEDFSGNRRPVISIPSQRGSIRDYQKTVNFARLSSPRRTWESMLRLMDEYSQEVQENGFTYANHARLVYLEEQIVNLFDLREVAPSLRSDVGMEAAVYLRDAIAHFDLPPSDTLPDRTEAFKEMKDGFPGIWNVYGSPIEISYIDSGEFKGRFQFSLYTALNARTMAQRVEHHTYVYPEFAGLREAYFNTPGPGIPDVLIDSLPGWMRRDLWGMRLWQFSIVLILTLGAVLLVLALKRLLRACSQRLPRAVGSALWLLLPLLIIYLAGKLNWFFSEHVFLTGKVLRIVHYVEEGVALLSLVAMILVGGGVLMEIIFLAPRFDKKGVNSYLIRFGLRLASIVVAAVVLLEGLQRMGFTLATVLAGAGVTGLAVALAAQESLRNIFGSIMLLLDKPFKIGQRVKVRGHDGFVEEIGLRSTKIRQLDGHLACLPNEDVARADIENISERPFIRRMMNLALPLDTPSDKVEEAVQIVRDLLAVHEVPRTEVEIAANPELEDRPRLVNEEINQPGYPPRIFFNEFNPASLNLLVIYWFHPPQYWDYLEHTQRINREIMSRFEEAGLRLALPAQRLQLAGDPSRPLEIGSREVNGDEDDLPLAGLREAESPRREPPASGSKS